MFFGLIRVYFWVFVLCFSLVLGCGSKQESKSVIDLTVTDSETDMPLADASVYVTHFLSRSQFDWEIETELAAMTDESGFARVYNSLENFNDSIRVEKSGYASYRIVRRSENEFIIVLRNPTDDSVISRDVAAFDEIGEIRMRKIDLETTDP